MSPKRGLLKCNLCHEPSKLLFIIDKQIGGEYRRLQVCCECKKEHERTLAMTRENFRRQFGDN